MSNLFVNYLLPRADPQPTGLSHQTLIIIIVTSSVVGGVILLLILYRTTRSCRSHRSFPLPPVQPLAHQREQQRVHLEALRAQSLHDSGYLAAPPSFSHSLGSPSLRGSKVSLLPKGSPSSRHTSFTPTAEGTEELSSLTPLEHSEILPVPYPSFLSSGPSSSSSINLDETPSTSSGTIPLSPSVLPRQTKSLIRLTRNDQHHRPLSVASSLSRATSRRGVPHGPHNTVQIILPTPLGPGMVASSTRQTLYEHDSLSASERMSIVDRWVPAGRDNIYERLSHDSMASLSMSSYSSTSNLAPPRIPQRAASNGAMVRQHSPVRPSVQEGHMPPPVPRVPSIYGKIKKGEED